MKYAVLLFLLVVGYFMSGMFLKNELVLTDKEMTEALTSSDKTGLELKKSLESVVIVDDQSRAIASTDIPPITAYATEEVEPVIKVDMGSEMRTMYEENPDQVPMYVKEMVIYEKYELADRVTLLDEYIQTEKNTAKLLEVVRYLAGVTDSPEIFSKALQVQSQNMSASEFNEYVKMMISRNPTLEFKEILQRNLTTP